jgi:ribosomal protein L7/L12
MFAILEPLDFTLIGVLVAVVALTAWALSRQVHADRLRRLERKVDALVKHFNLEVPDPATAEGLSPEVRRLADNPVKKIHAIALHREQTGATLREAKDAVEAYINARHFSG